MDRAEKAVQLHAAGYNCAQSTACVFAEAAGVPESMLYRVTEGFGHGMGTGEGICGAMSGVAALIGLFDKESDINRAGESAERSAASFDRMLELFESQTKALICRDIKSEADGKPLTSCDDCIRIAVRAAEEVLNVKPEK